jgi:drug/metabolite transporter (DMT)-like permease
LAHPDATNGAAPLRGRRLIVAATMLYGLGIVWGLTYPIAKVVTESSVHPVGIALLQALIGGLALMPVVLVRRRPPPLTGRHVTVYVIAGTLGTALPNCVWFWVAPFLPSGLVAILMALVPMMTLGLALLLGVERFEAKRATGIVCGIVAVILIVVPETSLPERAMVAWVLIGLIVPLCYSTENVFLTLRRPPDVESATLLCGMMWAATALLVPVAWATDGWVWFPWPWDRTAWLFLGLASINVFAYLTFIEVIRMAGPVFASQQGYIVTITGVLTGMIFLGESHSGWVWVATAIMLAGLFLVTPRPHQEG